MTATISKDQRRRLRKLLLAAFANSKTQCAVLKFLFDAPGAVSAQDIIDDCQNGPKNDSAVRTSINRLRADVADYFSANPVGQTQRKKAFIPLRSYVLEFDENEPSTVQPPDLTNQFWSPYTISSKPVHLFYQEPQFFRDARETYIHSPMATLPDQRDKVSYLRAGKVSSNYGFVPAGLVQAILHLYAFFQRTRTPITSSVLRPSMEMPEPDQDLIVLATSTGVPHLLDRAEVSCPFRTQSDHITLRQPGTAPRSFRDIPKTAEGETAADLRCGLLTRRPHRIKGRTITVIAAHHARVVEAVAAFVTRDNELHQLAQQFDSSTVFPAYFQALFRVPILRTDAEPFLEPIVEEAINLERLGNNSPGNASVQL